MMAKISLTVFFFAVFDSAAFSQKKDTALIVKDSIIYKRAITDSAAKKDTLARNKHNPTQATLYSTIFPGLGQVYNKKYWKLPLVYAAVGIPTYTFVFNRSWYNKTKYALSVITNGLDNVPAAFNKIDPQIRQQLFTNGNFTYDSTSTVNVLILARDDYRKNEDYSVLFFLLFYALQIVDATVDAHLKDFNVSSDLSLRIAPAAVPGPGGTGLSLVFDIHRPKPKPFFDISQ